MAQGLSIAAARWLVRTELFGVAEMPAARAAESAGYVPGTGLVCWFLAALGVLLFGLLVWQYRAMSPVRRTNRAIEQVMGELTGETVRIEDVPARLARVRADTEMLLSSLDATEGRVAAHRDGPRHVLIDAAITLAEAASAAARAIPASPELGAVAGYNIAQEVDAAIQALKTASQNDTPATGLTNALRTGQLNHLLTVAPLLDAYFRDDPLYGPLRAYYRAAAGIIAGLLSEAGVVFDMPPLLALVPRASREAECRFADIRRLSKIKSVRDQVRSQARRLEEGELLIVDCMAPGWRFEDRRQPPTLVAYHRPDWTG
jgi:hypothetical protein